MSLKGHFYSPFPPSKNIWLSSVGIALKLDLGMVEQMTQC